MRGALGVAVVVATLLGGRASAAPPERHSLDYHDSFRTTDICGVLIRFDWIGTGYGTVFVDGDGEFVRQIDRIREKLTVTNVETGTTVSGHNAYQLSGTKESLTRTGSWFHLGAPGGGIVLRDVGRIVVTSEGEVTAIAGMHQWAGGDLDPLCHALSS